MNPYYAIKEDGKPLHIHGWANMVKEWSALPAGGYKIEIKATGRTRTSRANGYYWLLMQIVSDALIEAGHDGTTKEMAHELFKGRFNYVEIVNEATREIEKMPKSTANLSKKEFGEYVEKIKDWCAQWLNLQLPEPTEQLTIE